MTVGARVGGYLAGSLAGLVWGLAFLIPVLLDDWSAVTVTAGRYLAYGAVSVLLFAVGGSALRGVARRHWRPALVFAVTGNVGYYLLLVIGLELIGPAASIIIGAIPVTMAVAGNVLTRTYRWRSLAVPIVLVAAGLAVVNVLAMAGASAARHASVLTTALGVLVTVAAVALWTWYGLANAIFFTRNPDVPHGGWATVVGLATGAITLVVLPLAAVTGQLDAPGGAGTRAVVALVLGSVVLGVLVSWAATTLWNNASARLSPTAAGMLINVETVAGYGYLYAARGEWPPVGQLLGFALVLAGVVLIVRLPATEAPATEAPATEAPATEAPATEAPATVQPVPDDAAG
jgi:drug/metabolite transporter (DMT)-like permease